MGAWLVNDENEDRPLLGENEDPPLLDDVTPIQWDPQAEASYEAAIEAINQQIAELSELIFDERQKDQPDQDRIDSLLRSQEQWSTRSASLRVGDAAQLDVDLRLGETRTAHESLSHSTTE